MKRTKRLFLTAAFVIGIAFSISTPAHAQPGYGQGGYGQTVTCSSNDGKRNFCNADTRGGVRLTRQISGSACIQGQTWGYDNRSIWVDRGCRAEFVTGNGGNWGGGGGSQSLTCSSNDGKRNFCNADTRGGVRLTRQISGSACIQGQTWGYDNRSIWVDRGCRAEFITGSGGGGYPGRQPVIITCSSNNGKRNFCDTNGGRDVRLTRQISGSACIQGQTWDYDNRSIWVDRGCRAEFSVR
ncbi:MAG TPA: DUF3011 domain-containing protein [Edaphobacter sp.]|nr:DUF3011 domain-containing protein [Edaphobacter sp.]